MKKVFTVLVAFILMVTMWAQSPQKISYQAVVRNNSDVLVTNSQIGMEINIRQGSPSGTVIYTETQLPITNANGLVSIEIGEEIGFDAIDWANGPYFVEIKTAVIPPLTTYTITSVSQLLSVPYALYAKNAETLSGTINETDPVFTAWDKNYADLINTPATADGSETKIIAGANISIIGTGTTANPYVVNATGGSFSHDFYLGQDTLGGIVFYIYLDQNGDQRGLIISKTQTIAKWQDSASITNATRSWDGAYNMNLMTNSPAKNWITTNFSADWYLPSIDELSILWHNRFHVNKALNDAGATLFSNTANYWSSTEYNDYLYAFFFYFYYGSSYHHDKTGNYYIRAVRAF